MQISWQTASQRSGSMKKCAFCRHWYDPTQAHIRPKAPAIGLWEFDPRVQAMCLKKNVSMPSFACCPRFLCKIEG